MAPFLNDWSSVVAGVMFHPYTPGAFVLYPVAAALSSQLTATVLGWPSLTFQLLLSPSVASDLTFR